MVPYDTSRAWYYVRVRGADVNARRTDGTTFAVAAGTRYGSLTCSIVGPLYLRVLDGILLCGDMVTLAEACAGLSNIRRDGVAASVVAAGRRHKL